MVLIGNSEYFVSTFVYGKNIYKNLDWNQKNDEILMDWIFGYYS